MKGVTGIVRVWDVEVRVLKVHTAALAFGIRWLCAQ